MGHKNVIAGKSLEFPLELPLSICEFSNTTVVDANGCHFAETESDKDAALIVHCVNSQHELAANQPEE